MDTFKIDWPAVEAAMADLDNTTVLDEWQTHSKRYRELLDARNKARSKREADAHRALLRSLPPNTELTYKGHTREFQGRTILLEKCNPKYVLVQIKDVPGKKAGWTRWNLYYSDLKVGPLNEMERSNRFINNTLRRMIGA